MRGEVPGVIPQQERDQMTLNPFISEGAVRRRAVGIDVWLELRHGARDATSGALVGALCGTHARLAEVHDAAGRRLWPRDAGTHAPDAAGGDGQRLPSQVRCRIVARRADTHLTGAALGEVLAELSRLGDWTLVRRLDERDGHPAFDHLEAI